MRTRMAHRRCVRKLQRACMPAPRPACPWLRCAVLLLCHLHRSPWRRRAVWRLRQRLHGKARWPSRHPHQPTSVQLRTKRGRRSTGLAQVSLLLHPHHRALCDPQPAQCKRTESAAHGEALSTPCCSACLHDPQVTFTCFLCIAGRPGLEPSQIDQLAHVWHSSVAVGGRCAARR